VWHRRCSAFTGREKSDGLQSKRSELFFTPMSPSAYVDDVIAHEPDAPADLSPDAEATLDAIFAVELPPLTLGDVLRAQRRGAQVLDTRSPEAFASGHLADSTHIALGGSFASWAETLLSPERPIVLVGVPGREEETAARLRRVGFDRVIGYLSGGIEAVRHLLALVRHPVSISSARLRQRLAQGPLTLIDVRAEADWRREAIPGSINIPLQHLRERVAEIPAGPVVVYCWTGERSSTAASLLEQTGRMNIVDLAGGLASWQALGSNIAACSRRSPSSATR
jgi:hydroxyacylglutathione hydrolase